MQLHTLEDFSAHSNFCELTLVNMGHSSVFLHVGDHVRIQAPNGRSVAPLVTGKTHIDHKSSQFNISSQVPLDLAILFIVSWEKQQIISCDTLRSSINEPNFHIHTFTERSIRF